MPGIDSNTKLMLHFQRPDNTAPKAITFAGTAQLSTAQKKYGASSLLLDGNSDYLTTPDSNDWNFSNGSFTIDCWVRLGVVAGNNTQSFLTQSTDDNNFWEFTYNRDGVGVNGGQTFAVATQTGGVGDINIRANSTFVQNQWHHVAVVRNGNTWYLFFDGVSQSLTLVYGAYNCTLPNCTGVLNIGCNYSRTSQFLNGYMDGVRVSKGIARWTADFTPPTYAPLSDTNTQLLLNFDGANAATATYDSAGGDENGTADKPPTFAGTAQIDTAQSKFGGASLLLDGNSDYLTIPDSADWYFGTGNFTVDLWVRFNAISAFQTFMSQYIDGNNYYLLAIDQDNKLSIDFTFGGVAVGRYLMTSAWSGLATGTWYHIAFERVATTCKIFIDGVSQTLTELNAIGTSDVGDLSGNLVIGRNANAGWGQYVNGWIDEFRVSKGIARWTANFTPPTAEYDSNPTTISKVSGVAYSSIKKINGVAIASVKKVAGVA
jgi:hypothetical protein